MGRTRRGLSALPGCCFKLWVRCRGPGGGRIPCRFSAAATPLRAALLHHFWCKVM